MHVIRKKKNIRVAGALFVLLWICISSCKSPTPLAESNPASAPGSFKVVGTGPGDGDLLTARAVSAVARADLVFCSAKTKERLQPYVDFSGKEVLDGYNVLFRYYGKDCAASGQDEQSRHSMSCEDYHRKQAEFAAMVRAAVAAGRHVVILSGGDPTIYGPDIWSLRELRDLDPELVPGLSCFNAASAALKVSLGEVILTAPFKRENHKDNIEQLAGHERATLVIFMPRDMKALFSRLAASYTGDTPAAIVNNAGLAGREKIALGTVGGFAAGLSGMDSRLSLVYVGKALAGAQCNAKPATASAGKGKFCLVGMGPGDPDLATLRALKAVEQADLIFTGMRIKEKFARELAGKEVIDGYGRLFPFYGQKCTDVPKTDQMRERMSCEQYHQKQAEFAARVRAAVAEGKTVAMLDSGDPLIYGPCSWSLTELRDLDTEVVPGLSCFNAANAALRAGVTEGHSSHSVILASGWSVEEMAAYQGAMALFTMRTAFGKFVDSLSRHYPSDTPVAVVFSAGYADRQRVLHGTLSTIVDDLGTERPPFEYMLYVGDFLEDSVDRLIN